MAIEQSPYTIQGAGPMRDPATNISSRPDTTLAARPAFGSSSIIVLVLALALGATGTWYIAGRANAPASAARGPAQPPTLPPIPVTVIEAARRDFPVYVRGIGAVQAYNTVTVKSRVDGELQQVLFREGQDVRTGDLLAQIDPRPFETVLRQTEAAKARDLAQLDTAKRDFARSEQLVDRGFTTRQTYETQRNLIAQLEAALLADEAAIDSAKLQLGYARIASPLNGRTGVRLVDAGNMIRASDAGGIVSITQLQPIAVLFTLPQELLGDVAAAMRSGRLTTLAYTQDNKRLLATGSLELIDNAIDQATGTMRLKASFPNDDEALWPGQFVNVRLTLATRRDKIVVAGAAVQRNQEGTFAWVVKPDGTVEVRPIKIEAARDDEALVGGGLAPGERVVVAGQSRLRPGVKVALSRSSVRPNLADARAAEGQTR
jgi:multidrug efflux system membrane fusion protein